MNAKTAYIKRIRQTFYVRIKVPEAARSALGGKSHVVQSLRTRDLDVANRLKWPIIEAIKRRIERAMSDDPAVREAAKFREALRTAREEGDDYSEEILESVAADKAEQMVRTSGDTDAAREWFKLATTDALTLDLLVERWLAESEYTKQTTASHKSAYTELRSYLKGDRMPLAVTDDVAVGFVEALKNRGQSYATQRRKLNSLVGFWQWLGMRRHVPRGANPFKGFRLRKRGTTARPEGKKRAYSEAELLTLLGGRPKYTGLADVIVLGATTGMRLDEICSLHVTDVEHRKGVYWLCIRRAKTEAGVRTLAVAHPTAVRVLKRRLREKGPQLFPEFKPGGYDEKLSWAVSKAFGRHRDKLALPRSLDFHGLRRSFITMLENADVTQVRLSRYVGHRVGSLAGDVYSSGMTEAVNMEVAKAVQYSTKVERALVRLAT